MDHFIPGSVEPIESVEPGRCFLFSIHQEMRLGFMVEAADKTRAILDVNAVDQQGDAYPAIYRLDYFQNEPVFVYKKAIILPQVKVGSVGYGHHLQGAASKALYLIEQKLVILASHQRHVMRLDLLSGQVAQVSVSQSLHATVWSVEAPDHEGRFRSLAEFRA